MIDIHNHLLFGVDDGPKSAEESIMMLRDAKQQGIDAIILTPHYRHGYFTYPVKEIMRNFDCLKVHAEAIGIDIYLGTEYHVNSRMVDYLEMGRCKSLANSRYVLAEYEYETEFSYVKSSIHELLLHGYVPVVAHVERYECMLDDLHNAEILREMGALIQVNAGAILGDEGRAQKKYCKKMLQNGLVDIVASDSHGIKYRTNQMGKCKQYLTKKYDPTYVLMITEENPRKIIKNIEE